MSKHQHAHKTSSYANSVSDKNGLWHRRPFRSRSAIADVKSFDLDESLISQSTVRQCHERKRNPMGIREQKSIEKFRSRT